MPESSTAEPLLEIDRNPQKLESLIMNEHVTKITAGDLLMFVPFGLNLDPYLRKMVREHMRLTHQLQHTAHLNHLVHPFPTVPMMQPMQPFAEHAATHHVDGMTTIAHPVFTQYPGLTASVQQYNPQSPTGFSGAAKYPPKGFAEYPLSVNVSSQQSGQYYPFVLERLDLLNAVCTSEEIGQLRASLLNKPLRTWSSSELSLIFSLVLKLSSEEIDAITARSREQKLTGLVLSLTQDLDQLNLVFQLKFGDSLLLKSLLQVSIFVIYCIYLPFYKSSVTKASFPHY